MTPMPKPRAGRPHVCDDLCVCPIHDTPLLYAPASNEHACQDPDCEHAHGIDPLWTLLSPMHPSFSALMGFPRMRDLVGPPMFGTPVVPTAFLSLYEEPTPLFPEAIDQLLVAASEQPAPGPPFVHRFQHPLPETVLVEGDDGEVVEVERWPLLPHYTITRAPEFTGVLGYLEGR